MEDTTQNTSLPQIKSRQRVAEHGEVFTADREVEAMCRLVENETERIDSRFLEPACGDGNFLAFILRQKLAVVTRKYKRSAYDWERYALLALGSLYGVDIQQDNVEACRQRLLALWNAAYTDTCRRECHEAVRESARFILSRNIICGNALSLTNVAADGTDLGSPIVFSEWSFPLNDARIRRKDYTFAELLATDDAPTATAPELELDFDAPEEDGVLLQQSITHYRRLTEADGTPR